MNKPTNFFSLKVKSSAMLAASCVLAALLSVSSVYADSSCADSCTKVWGTTAKQNCEFSYFNCKRVYTESIDQFISEINNCDLDPSVDPTDCKIAAIAKASSFKHAYDNCNLSTKLRFPLSMIPR